MAANQDTEPRVTHSHCNGCGRTTKHFIHGERVIESAEEIEPQWIFHTRDEYQLLECCGCEQVSMSVRSTDESSDEATVTTYPPKSTRRRPTWLNDVPKAIGGILDQVYTAMDANSRALAVMGVRTAIDLLLTDKVQDVGTFNLKLDALAAGGFIGAIDRKHLEAALEAGNAATHRGHVPSLDDVQCALNIAESVLHATYILPAQAARLNLTTPPRQKTQKPPDYI